MWGQECLREWLRKYMKNFSQDVSEECLKEWLRNYMTNLSQDTWIKNA